MKRRVIHWANFDSSVGQESHFSPSQTVPDMSMSLQELLARYTRGQSIPMFQPVYQGEDEMPDVSRMTKMEQLDYALELRQNIESYRRRPAPVPLPPDIVTDDVAGI